MINCRISKYKVYLSWDDAAYIKQEDYEHMCCSHMWFGISTVPHDKKSLRYSTLKTNLTLCDLSLLLKQDTNIRLLLNASGLMMKTLTSWSAP